MTKKSRDPCVELQHDKLAIAVKTCHVRKSVTETGVLEDAPSCHACSGKRVVRYDSAFSVGIMSSIPVIIHLVPVGQALATVLLLGYSTPVRRSVVPRSILWDLNRTVIIVLSLGDLVFELSTPV